MDGARKKQRETTVLRKGRLTQWLSGYKRVKKLIKSILSEYGEHSPELVEQTEKSFNQLHTQEYRDIELSIVIDEIGPGEGLLDSERNKTR